jgi:hypothetical protein
MKIESNLHADSKSSLLNSSLKLVQTPTKTPLKAVWRLPSGFINSAIVTDRLNQLASRENTVIDNPYHNSHIARVFNATRDNQMTRAESQEPVDLL